MASKKTINLRGMIGVDENATPKFLGTELAAAKGGPVEIEMNSPGGFLGPGLEMANKIRNYSGHTTIRIVGTAASMASYITMMADEIIAENNAVMMIHNPITGGFGMDHRSAAKLSAILKSTTEMLANAYAARSGKGLAEIRQIMDDETFMFGPGIERSGFADSTAGIDDIDHDQAAIAAAQKEAVAIAKADIQACEDLMKGTTSNIDPEKLVAMLGSMGQSKPTANHNQEPEMDEELKALLEKNPKAKAQYDKMVADAEAKGKTDALAAIKNEGSGAPGGEKPPQKLEIEISGNLGDTEKMAAVLGKGLPIMASADYPEDVKKRVAECIVAVNKEGIENIVSIYDMVKAQTKTEAAGEEEGKPTPAQDQAGNNANDLFDAKMTALENIRA